VLVEDGGVQGQVVEVEHALHAEGRGDLQRAGGELEGRLQLDQLGGRPDPDHAAGLDRRAARQHARQIAVDHTHEDRPGLDLAAGHDRPLQVVQARRRARPGAEGMVGPVGNQAVGSRLELELGGADRAEQDRAQEVGALLQVVAGHLQLDLAVGLGCLGHGLVGPLPGSLGDLQQDRLVKALPEALGALVRPELLRADAERPQHLVHGHAHAGAVLANATGLLQVVGVGRAVLAERSQRQPQDRQHPRPQGLGLQARVGGQLVLEPQEDLVGDDVDLVHQALVDGIPSAGLHAHLPHLPAADVNVPNCENTASNT
jgi:hypothetical protein